MTFALLILVSIAVARAGAYWWLCRTPLERVNYDLARARARRRR